MEVPLGKGNAFLLQNHKQGNRHADGLREGCAECRTGRAEAKRANEKIIQHDICRTCNRNEIHRAFAVTHATENGADDVIRRNKGNPQKADSQICNCAVYRLRRGGHYTDNRAHQKQKHCRQHNGKPEKERHSVADAFRNLLMVSAAHCTRNADGCPHRKPYEHNGQHVHHLRADGNGCGAGNPIKLPDNE